MDKIRIGVFDESNHRMITSFRAFRLLLKDYIMECKLFRNEASIKTAYADITFKTINTEYSGHNARGYRFDYVINNTQGEEFNRGIALNLMRASHLDRMYHEAFYD